MAELKTFVLRVWADGDAPAGEAPVQLLRRDPDGSLAEVASHAAGVPAGTTIAHGGADVDLGTLFTQANLLKDDLMTAVGRELYRRLAAGDVGQALKQLGLDTRVMLDLKSQALDGLPWELIRRDGHLLFRIEDHPWMLGSPEAPAPDPLSRGQVPLAAPLRVMVVVGNKPDDKKVLGDDELRRLEDRLHARRGDVLLRILVRPTPARLLDEIPDFEPHVFHFVGHGEKEDGKTVIKISNDDGQTEVWDAARIRDALGEKKKRVPRLVILNACDTAGPGIEGAWALTEAFLGLGAGALIAMQAEIRGDAALAFGDGLYGALAEGLAVDQAVARARRKLAALAGDGSTAARANWPLPRLVVRGLPEDVIRLGGPAPGIGSVRAERDFVDRWRQRARACQVLSASAGGERHLVVLDGPEKTGKTELLKVLGETWTRAGNAALYVHLGPATANLALVATRTAEVAGAEGLDAGPLHALDTGLDNAALGKRFRAALEVMANKPLLLLLDGLEKWQQDVVVNTVIPRICAPYHTAGSDSRVWLAVALPEPVSKAFQWPTLGDFEPIRVDHFSPEEWRRAAAQFIRWHGGQVPNPQGFEGAAWPAAQLVRPGELIEPPRQRYQSRMLEVIRIAAPLWGQP